MQFLYSYELNRIDLSRALDQFWSIKPINNESREFTERLVRGTVENEKKIDDLIAQHTINWDMDRIAIIDKNILRIAAYELIFCSDIPPIVSINEAVDIAKKFSTPDSGKFVNGVLDKLRKIVTASNNSEN